MHEDMMCGSGVRGDIFANMREGEGIPTILMYYF